MVPCIVRRLAKRERARQFVKTVLLTVHRLFVCKNLNISKTRILTSHQNVDMDIDNGTFPHRCFITKINTQQKTAFTFSQNRFSISSSKLKETNCI